MSDVNLRKAEGPAVWTGPEMATRDDWKVDLGPEHLAELESACAGLLGAGHDIAGVRREDAVMPALDRLMEGIAGDVRRGRGFVLLRGLLVARWSREMTALAYWLIGTRLGIAVPQNGKGHVLGHVRDLGDDPLSPMTRIYTTRAAQEYHTDSCDIVGLLCLRPSRSGGASSIVSSTTIWNAIVERRPDLARVLLEPFVLDRKGEVPPGKQATYPLPIFHDFGGHISALYARSFVRAAQARPETPRLTPQQEEAMDMVDCLAASDELRLDMDFRPGDMQFLHNHQILHARTAYEDWPEPERKRHLLRLWLSTPDGRPLPECFAERYGTVEPGAVRGGIRTAGQTPQAPLEP